MKYLNAAILQKKLKSTRCLILKNIAKNFIPEKTTCYIIQAQGITSERLEKYTNIRVSTDGTQATPYGRDG